MPFGRSLLHKFGLHFVQYILLLFTHCLSEHICLSFGKSGNFLGKEHDLLLVDRDPIGFLQVLLHILQIIGNGLCAMLSLDKGGDVGQRTGSIEGVHSYEISKNRRF